MVKVAVARNQVAMIKQACARLLPFYRRIPSELVGWQSFVFLTWRNMYQIPGEFHLRQ
jgi:hypothetical protein